MANDSQIVLRYEIDNPFIISPDNLPAPEVINGGGFEWKASLRPNANDNESYEFLLGCNGKLKGWNCKAKLKFVMHSDNDYEFSHEKFHIFNEAGPIHEFKQFCFDVHESFWYIDNKWIASFFIAIQSSKPGFVPAPIDLSVVCSPFEANNVILVFGDEKLRISKDFLAMHSDYFKAMFTLNFAERNKEEVEIKDAAYEDFIDLLRVINPVDAQISDYSIVHVLTLGDRFQIKKVMLLISSHLMTSDHFDKFEKLHLSDQYRFEELTKHCLMSFSTVDDIYTLKSTPEYAQFSDKTKAAICDRIMELA